MRDRWLSVIHGAPFRHRVLLLIGTPKAGSDLRKLSHRNVASRVASGKRVFVLHFDTRFSLIRFVVPPRLRLSLCDRGVRAVELTLVALKMRL